LKERGGYRLEGSSRRTLDAKYGQHPTVLIVTQILSTLPERVPDLAERAFLREAIDCYRVRAFRATIVMTWNLAFDHLRRWILADADRVSQFNAAIAKKFPKKTASVARMDDFEELKEAEVVEVCRTANLFSKSIADILREKLTKRNIAAHPSQIAVTQHQADDAITDLVNNVVLALV
jgi:hypothetical protein